MPQYSIVIFMDAGRIVEDCTRDAFFGNLEARAPLGLRRGAQIFTALMAEHGESTEGARSMFDASVTVVVIAAVRARGKR